MAFAVTTAARLLLSQERLARSIEQDCVQQGEWPHFESAVVELSEGDTVEMFLEHARMELK